MAAVGDVELAVFRVVWMKGQTQKPSFIKILPQLRNMMSNIQKRITLQLAVGMQNLDQTKLFYDELTIIACRLYHR